MAVPTPPRSLKIGTIIDKTLGVIERNVTPVLAYVAGLTVINGAITYFSRDMTRVTDALVLGIAGIAVGIVAAYLLLEAGAAQPLGKGTAAVVGRLADVLADRPSAPELVEHARRELRIVVDGLRQGGNEW